MAVFIHRACRKLSLAETVNPFVCGPDNQRSQLPQNNGKAARKIFCANLDFLSCNFFRTWSKFRPSRFGRAYSPSEFQSEACRGKVKTNGCREGRAMLFPRRVSGKCLDNQIQA
jgi:hypothetical protein